MVAEAMALGVPIVAYDVDAIREICGVGGAPLLKTGSVGGSTKHLVSLIHSKVVPGEMGETATLRTWKMLTVEEVVQAYSRIIENIAFETQAK